MGDRHRTILLLVTYFFPTILSNSRYLYIPPLSMSYSFLLSIGIKRLRFKPAYNPYTEPSMEIFGYHPELGKWTEIGDFHKRVVNFMLFYAL